MSRRKGGKAKPRGDPSSSLSSTKPSGDPSSPPRSMFSQITEWSKRAALLVAFLRTLASGVEALRKLFSLLF